MHIQNLLLTQMKYYDDRILFTNIQENFTYSEIFNNTLKLAHYFHSMKLARGDYLALYLPTSIESIAIFYATQLLGITFVPLNINWSPKVIQKIISKLTSVALIGDIQVDGSINTISTHKIHDVINNTQQEKLREFPKITSQDISTILFSSGTTGEPKGIMLSHESLYRKAKLFVKSYIWQENDIVLILGDIHSIDRLRNGCIAPLFVGNSIIVDTKKRKFFSDIADIIEENACTITNMTPTLIKQFNLHHEEIQREKLNSLRMITSAGNILSNEDRRTFEKLFHQQIFTYYGLTEAAGFCAGILPTDIRSNNHFTGKAIECEMKIINEEGHSVASGTKGELLIKSDIPFMSGYYDNLELTEQTIQDGWLHTGDFASLSEEGELNVLGRMKDVFKNIYEELIYPTEIEMVIAKHKEVLECCVFDYQARFAMTRIAVVISTHKPIENKQRLFRELKTLVASELGSHKTPSFYEIVEKFPKTNHAKIKRHALKDMFFGEEK